MKPLHMRASVTKSTGSWAREVSLEETWSRLMGIRHQFGLTKVYDLTGLDVLDIPAYSAITPFGNDTISVYHGKGLTPLAAQVSAAMEAFERNAAALPLRPVRIASVEHLASEGIAFLDPDDFHVRTSATYRSDRPISWIESWDLLNHNVVLVPHHGAAYGRAAHEPAVFHVITTSGIASGNSTEEAIAHALCEVIERDAVTLQKVAETCYAQSGDAHGSPSRHVDLSDIPPEARALVDKFERAGLDLTVEFIASDVSVPVFAATANDNSELGSQVGYGASPNATIALVRALTECAQSRAAEFEHLREDLQLPANNTQVRHGGGDGDLVRRRTSSPMPIAGISSSARVLSPAPIRFSTIGSFESNDIIEDIDFLTTSLRDAGLSRILVCDMTPPDAPFSVVRVIVPGLETWAFDNSKLANRALEAWNRQAARTSTGPTPSHSPERGAAS
jgi:ribosomal protein S12 methylthiotransferase accessory factor